MQLGNEVVHSTDSDHVTINKFGKGEQQRYQPVGNAIKELVMAANSELMELLEGR
jgi:hypothetical protein